MNIDETIIEELGTAFKNKHYSLVTAESCTGGGLTAKIIANPHSSFIIERGYIVYSTQSKKELLNVSSFTSQVEGTVSEKTAIEMAEGALKNSHAQISIAITGINENETTQSLAWISCAGINKKTITQLIKYKGNRRVFCEKIVSDALKFLLTYVKRED